MCICIAISRLLVVPSLSTGTMFYFDIGKGSVTKDSTSPMCNGILCLYHVTSQVSLPAMHIGYAVNLFLVLQR